MYHEPLLVISDFGISKMVATNYSKTTPLEISTQWAAHEQLNLRKSGKSSDIFLLGLVRVQLYGHEGGGHRSN